MQFSLFLIPGQLNRHFKRTTKCYKLYITEILLKVALNTINKQHTDISVLFQDLSQITNSIHGENGILEGYLFKKTSKGFKSWVRLVFW